MCLGLRRWALEVRHRTSDTNVFTVLVLLLWRLVRHVLRLRLGMRWLMGHRRRHMVGKISTTTPLDVGLVGHRGRHMVTKISATTPLYVELLSGGQVRQVEVASVWRGVWIRDPCAKVLVRGVRILWKSKLIAAARQTWVVHALGELWVRVVSIHRILGSAILRACVHRLLKGTVRCL